MYNYTIATYWNLSFLGQLRIFINCIFMASFDGGMLYLQVKPGNAENQRWESKIQRQANMQGMPRIPKTTTRH